MERTLFGYVAIPSTDFARAMSFYGRHLVRHNGVPFPMAYLEDSRGGVVGHLPVGGSRTGVRGSERANGMTHPAVGRFYARTTASAMRVMHRGLPFPAARARRVTRQRKLWVSVLTRTVVCCALAGVGAEAQARDTVSRLDHCEAGEVEVMLLGTMHFDGSGSDVVGRGMPDVLVQRRQVELDTVVARLGRWKPEQVAVEWPLSFAESTAVRYARYVAGTLAPSRNEVVQLGFRLARLLRHSAVYPIDAPMSIWNDSLEQLSLRRPDLVRRRDSLQAIIRRDAVRDGLLAPQRAVLDQLIELNSDSALRRGNSLAMFGSFLAAGERDNYAGPDLLSAWYARNVRMAHHLTRVQRVGVRRIMVIVGSGHVPALRAVLDESPFHCPVSPLPVLRAHPRAP